MKDKLIEAGIIVNTHGIQGDVKIQPWCDSPDFLLDFDAFYIDGVPVAFSNLRVHKTNVLAKPAGADSATEAALLKNKVICIDRTKADIAEDAVFIADLIGLDAIDDETGSSIGKISKVLTLPASDVYVINGEHEYMVPVVNEFVKEVNADAGFVRLRLIKGFRTDEI